MESKLDWIEMQILDMSQYFGHNFQFKYGIEMNLAACEILYKILPIIVKYDFPNSNVLYAKIVMQ